MALYYISVPDENDSKLKSRQKRDLYGFGPKYLEVMVATDNTVVDFHGRTLFEQYLITQMYIVSICMQKYMYLFNKINIVYNFNTSPCRHVNTQKSMMRQRLPVLLLFHKI